MSAYYFNQGALNLPQKWEDKTIVGFSFPQGAKQPAATIAITLDVMPDDVTLGAYIDKHLKFMPRNFSRYEFISREELEINEKPAIQINFSWRAPDRSLIQQQQTMLECPQGSLLTFTATAAMKEFDRYQKDFQSIINSFQCRQDGST